jgi:uncharacterized protein (UPF0147 family)
VPTHQKINEILKALKDLSEDDSVPKNIAKKVKSTIDILHKEDEEMGIRVHRALNELDDLADDVNVQPYTRTQIWNIVSALESI